MISEDLEIDLQPSSNVDSNNCYNENKKQPLNQYPIRVSTKIKRGRPPKQKKKAPTSQSTEERKSDESPDIIMIGSSKAKMAKANTIMKKIKKKFTSAKKHKKQVSEGIKKVQKQLKATTDKAQSKFQSVILSFKKFLKELKENMSRALDEGDKILKEIE